MADYVAKQGTTALGIIGTALGGIATVGPALVDALGGVNARNAQTDVAGMAAGAALAAALGAGNRSCDSNDRPVSRYELSLVQENAVLKAQADVDKKLVDVYNSVNNQVGALKDRLNDFEKQQLVYNGVNNAAVGVLQSQVAALMGLTKTVIPNGNVCPGWGDVKVEIVTPTTTATTTAA